MAIFFTAVARENFSAAIDVLLPPSARNENSHLQCQRHGSLPVLIRWLQEALKEIILHGKTGGATASSPGLGWFVGWVEQDGKVYPFALNIDMPDESIASRSPGSA